MTLNIFIYNFVVYIVMNVNFLPFLFHIFLNNFLNIFLVSCFAVCIGSTISVYLTRFSAYSLMIISIVVISPIFEFVPYTLYMGYGVNIYPFIEILNVLPPNLYWVEEELYGLAIEPYRWNLLLFWISFLSSILLVKLSRRRYNSLNFIAIGLIIVAILNLSSFTKPGSIVKKDHNPKSFIAFDELYYMNDIQKEEIVQFNISAYNMKFTINRQLNSDIIIYLDEKETLNSYKFTLYRNYKVKKVLSKNNEVLDYKRNGDYLEVINPTNKKLEEIRILYSGYSPVFYSNLQAVLLPGSFPYYPIEGYKKIYMKEESRFIPIIREQNTKFDVSIKSNLNIYSNLDKNDNNFSGESQELTLIGGFLEEKKFENNLLYGLILEKMDISFLLNIEKTLTLYKGILGEDADFNVSGKKIFQSPTTFSSKMLGDGIISFKDHIFVWELSKEQIALGLLQSNLSQDIKKRKINTLLFDYILNKDRFLRIPEEELNNNPSFEMIHLFLKKINELGEDYVIKNTYKFLKDNNQKRDSITFLKNLNN